MADPLMELQAIKKSLLNNTLSLEKVYENRPMLWQQLSWSQAQVRLWLISLPDMKIDNADSINPNYHLGGSEITGDDLGEIIAKIVEALGRPVPMAELRKKLPAGTIATDPMIKAAIQQHPHLVMTGPLIKLNRS